MAEKCEQKEGFFERIYAYYKPKRELTKKQKQMKERSQEIIIQIANDRGLI